MTLSVRVAASTPAVAEEALKILKDIGLRVDMNKEPNKMILIGEWSAADVQRALEVLKTKRKGISE